MPAKFVNYPLSSEPGWTYLNLTLAFKQCNFECMLDLKLRSMKRIAVLIVGILILIVMNNSCKESDERDQFVGTWTGLMIFSRIGYEFSTSVIITKSTTNSSQIIFEESGGSQRIVTINGNSYTYEQFTASYRTNQDEVAGNFNGAGSKAGDVLTESGTITSDNSPYPGDQGTWSRRLYKQK